MSVEISGSLSVEARALIEPHWPDPARKEEDMAEAAGNWHTWAENVRAAAEELGATRSDMSSAGKGDMLDSLQSSTGNSGDEFLTQADAAEATAQNTAANAQNLYNTRNILNAIGQDYDDKYAQLVAANMATGGNQEMIAVGKQQLMDLANAATALTSGAYDMSSKQLNQQAVQGMPMSAPPSSMMAPLPSTGVMPSLPPAYSASPMMMGNPAMAADQSQPGSLIGGLLNQAPQLIDMARNTPIGQAVEGLIGKFEQQVAGVINPDSVEAGSPQEAARQQLGIPGTFNPPSGLKAEGAMRLGDFTAEGSVEAGRAPSLEVSGPDTDTSGESGSGSMPRGGVPAGGSGGGSSAPQTHDAVPPSGGDEETPGEEPTDEETPAEETKPEPAAEQPAAEPAAEPAATEPEAAPDSEPLPPAEANTQASGFHASAQGEIHLSAGEAGIQGQSLNATAAPAAAAAPVGGGFMPMGAMGAMGAAGNQSQAAEYKRAKGEVHATTPTTGVAPATVAPDADEALAGFHPDVARLMRVAARVGDVPLAAALLSTGEIVYTTADSLGFPASVDRVPDGAIPLAVVARMAPRFFADWAGAADPASVLLLARATGMVGEIERMISVGRQPGLPELPEIVETVTPSTLSRITAVGAGEPASSWRQVTSDDARDIVPMLAESWGLNTVEVSEEQARAAMSGCRWQRRDDSQAGSAVPATAMWLVRLAQETDNEVLRNAATYLALMLPRPER